MNVTYQMFPSQEQVIFVTNLNHDPLQNKTKDSNIILPHCSAYQCFYIASLDRGSIWFRLPSGWEFAEIACMQGRTSLFPNQHCDYCCPSKLL